MLLTLDLLTTLFSASIVDSDGSLLTGYFILFWLIEGENIMSPFSFDRDFHKVLKFNVIHLLSCKISVALF